MKNCNKTYFYNSVYLKVGFDAGDRTNFFALPSSRTADIANIDDQSNVNLEGRWMFRTDLAEIIDAGVQPSCSDEGIASFKKIKKIAVKFLKNFCRL